MPMTVHEFTGVQHGLTLKINMWKTSRCIPLERKNFTAT